MQRITDIKGFCVGTYHQAQDSRFIFVMLFLFFICFPTPSIYVTNNTATYFTSMFHWLNDGFVEIYKGGYVARGPIYILYLSLVGQIVDFDLPSIFLLNKVIMSLVLTCVLSKCIGKSLILFSFVCLFFILNYKALTLYFLLDANSLLAIGNMALIYIAFHTKRWVRSILYAYVVVFLFLLKEIALILLPLVIWLHTWKLRHFSLVLPAYCSVAIWVAYVFDVTGSVWPVLGHFNPEFISLALDERTSDIAITQLTYQELAMLPIDFVGTMFWSSFPFWVLLVTVFIGCELKDLLSGGSAMRVHVSQVSISAYVALSAFALPVVDFLIGGRDPRQSLPAVFATLVFMLVVAKRRYGSI